VRKSRRVVITGLGVVAPNGIGKDAFWDALIAGKSGIDYISAFDASSYSCQIAGEGLPTVRFHLDPTSQDDGALLATCRGQRQVGA
jgi:3-oxoacyl-(acyl-carrier-protein) synthase